MFCQLYAVACALQRYQHTERIIGSTEVFSQLYFQGLLVLNICVN